jgi:hypothetical protein
MDHKMDITKFIKGTIEHASKKQMILGKKVVKNLPLNFYLVHCMYGWDCSTIAIQYNIATGRTALPYRAKLHVESSVNFTDDEWEKIESVRWVDKGDGNRNNKTLLKHWDSSFIQRFYQQVSVMNLYLVEKYYDETVAENISSKDLIELAGHILLKGKEFYTACIEGLSPLYLIASKLTQPFYE